MENKPKVSALIFTNAYRQEEIRVFTRCLDSLVYQTLEELEIIVIANHKKNLEDILTMYKNRFTNRTFHILPGSANKIKDLQMGCQIARGSYLHILEADVLLEYHAYATLYDFACQQGANDLIVGGYKQYENDVMIVTREKRSTAYMEYQYILKGDLILLNKIYRRERIEQLCRIIESEKEWNGWNAYGIAFLLSYLCNTVGNCNQVIFHELRIEDALKEDKEEQKTNLEENVLQKVQQLDRILQIVNQNTVMKNKAGLQESRELTKREHLYARAGLESIRLLQEYSLLRNLLLPYVKQYSAQLRKNTILLSYPQRMELLLQYLDLQVDTIPRIIYQIEGNQVEHRSKNAFLQGGEIKKIRVEYGSTKSAAKFDNPVIQRAYLEGKITIVEEYLAVKAIVKTGGFIIGKDTTLCMPLDGLCCYEAILGMEDKERITSGFFAGKKGHFLWKHILETYNEKYTACNGYQTLGERIRLCMMGEEPFCLNGKETLLPRGILLLSPDQCIYPRTGSVFSGAKMCLCMMSQTEQAKNVEYIVIRKSTFQYLMTTSQDTIAVNKLRNNNNQLKRSLNSLLQSRSIRLTRPLRSCYSKMKQLLHSILIW